MCTYIALVITCSLEHVFSTSLKVMPKGVIKVVERVGELNRFGGYFVEKKHGEDLRVRASIYFVCSLDGDLKLGLFIISTWKCNEKFADGM